MHGSAGKRNRRSAKLKAMLDGVSVHTRKSRAHSPYIKRIAGYSISISVVRLNSFPASSTALISSL
jgi:hypothetical protein